MELPWQQQAMRDAVWSAAMEGIGGSGDCPNMGMGVGTGGVMGV